MQKNKYQSIILELSESPQKKYSSLLKEDGSLWIITNHTYSPDCNLTPYDIIDDFIKEGFFLRNILIWVLPYSDNNSFITLGYKYIFLLSLNKDFHFNKDSIRENHKWAHLDWGKRTKKYNPLGKDPGNVWIHTIDDGKGNTIEHRPFSKEEIYERIILCSSKEQDNIYLNKDVNLSIKNRIIYNEIGKVNSNIYLSPVVSKTHLSMAKTGMNTTPYYQINYASSENMSLVKEKSIQTIITSPPYWDLKNYGNNNSQIGYLESYDNYHVRLNNVWKECFRTLKDNGSIFINVNTLTKSKEMLLIQRDIILNMRKIGFVLKDIIIWSKPSGIPNKYTLSDRFEYIMWFVKDISTYKVYDVQIDSNYLIKDLKGNYNVWQMYRTTGNMSDKMPHPAIYPNELVSKCIDLTTEEGDLILDPFLGSGTTLVEAINKYRSFIGYEVNLSYEDVIKYRMINQIKHHDYIKKGSD